MFCFCPDFSFSCDLLAVVYWGSGSLLVRPLGVIVDAVTFHENEDIFDMGKSADDRKGRQSGRQFSFPTRRSEKPAKKKSAKEEKEVRKSKKSKKESSSDSSSSSSLPVGATFTEDEIRRMNAVAAAFGMTSACIGMSMSDGALVSHFLFLYVLFKQPRKPNKLMLSKKGNLHLGSLHAAQLACVVTNLVPLLTQITVMKLGGDCLQAPGHKSCRSI